MKRPILPTLFRDLRRNDSGLALIEFAYALPILCVLSMGGIELANYALMNMRVSQAAMQISDNASRIGDRDALATQRIFEGDIVDIFTGVEIQAGQRADLFEQGRVILSSLEQNSEGGQWIHWQRCMGKKRVESAYGGQGTGASGTDFPGMGPAGNELQAAPSQAVMYVEIIYDYEPLITNDFAVQFVTSKTIRSESAFNVRGTRDLARIYQTPDPAPVRDCDQYTSE
ncbi:MAG: TadE/TadG family type IV pilus assembly protein [Pontixanthobacter sp.]